MADAVKARFAPGGARPAPATTVAATRSELFPGVDRPTMVLWLGVTLIFVSELVDYGPIATAVDAARGKQLKSNSLGIKELGIELLLLGFLYLLALASDNSGTVAVLIVVALWAAWLVRHASVAGKFLGIAANAGGQTKAGN